MSQYFTINVKNSSEHYLHLAYYTKELISGVSDTGYLERDLEVKVESLGNWMQVLSPFLEVTERGYSGYIVYHATICEKSNFSFL